MFSFVQDRNSNVAFGTYVVVDNAAHRTCTALDATSVYGNKTSAGWAWLVSVVGTRVVVVNSAAQRTLKVLAGQGLFLLQGLG